ncbi:Stp1/IreP family PP2C-type Ser/Thr phosphatase [Dictyobacter arantiisoli]|uniref:PPM-type phosphatase domain-containing protein n=1 Tax=Dictyobacter arantiisoli TaxID=2014874 RepID=A0A5A5T9S2_9CHLR|nr:Stp1/IreP family PP2C-type Ser/Thr phosphatase [Dictyobacter arantiisoli]GCF07896.1 hypothetical protein KDI_14600 [Dictyobacter arantiisoli]
MSKQLRLDVAQLTDVGRKRPHNEDNMAYVIPRDSQVMAKKGALFIVADGMGGHAAGEVASEIAVDTVSNVYYQDENDDIPLSLMNAIKRANALIHQRAAENMMRSGMGTTCVAAVFRGGVAYIANVGDSRAYMVRHGQSKQISQDHSWVEEQVRAGLLTKDQARSHAQRNVITRALGTQAEVEVDVFTELLEESDTFVLCSDGLSGPVGEDDLRAIVNKYLPQESVYHLVERANENGGADNITAIVVRVQEAGDDIPATLLQHPVHAGSSEHPADESTVVLGRVPSSSLSMPSGSFRIDNLRVNSRPLNPTSDQFFMPTASGNTAPVAAAALPKAKKRRRVLVPVLVTLLLIVAVGAAGAYYFLLPSDAQADLAQADTLIGQAKGDLPARPGDALTLLTKAQVHLHSAKNASLNPQQSSQLKTLQDTFTSDFKVALSNYNQQSSVTLLPCTTHVPIALNMGNQNTQTMSVANIKVDNNHSSTYILGGGDLYQVNAQNTLVKVTPGPDKIALIANDAQYLYTLTTASAVKAGTSINYRLHAYKMKDGKLAESVANGTVIKADFLKGSTPQLMTAWNGAIYVFSTSSQTTPNQATVLKYSVDKLNNTPISSTISISTSLVSAVALPDDLLFLLHSDGQVKSLHFTTVNPLEDNVLVQGAVATPWSLNATNFNVATPVATPTTSITKFLSIPPPTAQIPQSLLTAGQVGKQTHVFLVDNTNHRVMDFAIVSAGNTPASTATPTPTTNNVGGKVVGSGGLAGPSVQLIRQYASVDDISAVKSLTFDTGVNQINLLGSAKGSPAPSQITVDVSSATACTPAP